MPRTGAGRYAAAPGDGTEDARSKLTPAKIGKPRKGYAHFEDDDQEAGSDGSGPADERGSRSCPLDDRLGPGGGDGLEPNGRCDGLAPNAAVAADVGGAADADACISEVVDLEDSPRSTPSGPGERGKRRTMTCAIMVLTFNAALGGFLFGYDTGVVSGAMLQIRTKRQGLGNLSPAEQEIIVSSTVGAAVVGSLLSGHFQKQLWFGRKGMLIIGCFLFAAGAVQMGISWSVSSLTAGRTIVGVAVGIVSHAVPLYISECVPGSLRGRLVTVNSICIIFGQVAASLICCAIARARVYQGWRWMLGLGGVPAMIMGLGFLGLPESPRYILLRGGMSDESQAKAEQVLVKLRGRSKRELVQAEIDAAVEFMQANQGSKSMWQLLAPRGVRRALALGIMLQLMQQLAGINTLMYYAATILQMSSSGADMCPAEEEVQAAGGSGNMTMLVSATVDQLEGVTEICMSAFVALAQLAGTLFGMLLVDRFGRRPLVLGSLGGVVVSLFLLGLSFHRGGLEMEHGPLVAMVIYLVFFGIGMAPLPWIVNSEIYPMESRSLCIGLATAANWVANFFVAATFMDLSEALSFDKTCPSAHPDGAFWLYAFISAAGFCWLFVKMPETKGLSLEEISDLFEGPREESPSKAGALGNVE